MKKFKMIVISFAAVLMATVVYAQDLQSVSFDDYLKAFDYKERKNMKIEIPEMLDLYKQGQFRLLIFDFRKNIRHTVSASSKTFR